MTARGRDSERRRRRGSGCRLGLFALVLSLSPVPAVGQVTPPPIPAAEVVELGRIEGAAIPTPPFFVGLAQVIAPPGATTTTTNTAGPRLIAVKTGSLTVAIDPPAGNLGLDRGPAADAQTSAATARATLAATVTTTIIEAGEHLVIEPGQIREIRNEASRPAIYYDAALFAIGSRRLDGALTTPEGFSFQLLVGVTVETPSPGAVTVVLERVDIPPGGGLPSSPRLGPALAYVASGALRLTESNGAVQYSRAAAAAAYATAGPMRVLAPDTNLTLTAGGSLFLPARATISAENERRLPAQLLMVELAPVGS